MKLHEYQAKARFQAAGLAVPEGVVVGTADEAAAAFTKLGRPLAVVKAQVHAGGRGKGGGVKLVRSAAEAEAAARTILSRPLVTPQTGPQGVRVRLLLVEEGLEIDRQLYAAVVLDRRLETFVLMASAEGGMEIEEVAAKRPQAILREPIHPYRGLDGFRARRTAYRLGAKKETVGPLSRALTLLARVALDTTPASSR